MLFGKSLRPLPALSARSGIHLLSPVLFLATSLMLAGAVKAAELPGGGTIKFEYVVLNDADGVAIKYPLPLAAVPAIEVQQYFNLAHCVCSAALPDDATYKQQSVGVQFRLVPGAQQSHVPVQYWVGAQCDNDTLRDPNCTQLGGIADLQTTTVTPEVALVPLSTLLNPKTNVCDENTTAGIFWALVDGDQNGSKEYTPNLSLNRDTKSPPLPTDFTANGAENAIQINWTSPVANLADVNHYEALCSKVDGIPALDKPVASDFQTAQSLCGVAQLVPVVAQPIEGGTNPVTVVPAGIAALDENFVCGKTTTNTSTSMRIEGLENDVEYVIALVAVDRSGNPAATYFTSTLTPKPVIDFWEDLNSRGSKVKGGYCLMAQTYGDNSPLTQALRSFRDGTLAHSSYGRALTRAYYSVLAPLGNYVGDSLAARIVVGLLLLPLVVVALAWHVLTLPGLFLLIAMGWMIRHRKRGLDWQLRARTGAAIAVITVLSMSSQAKAQSSSRPYWEDDLSSEADTQEDVRWHIGLRVGPYTPAIDAQFVAQGGTGPAPYGQMFGTKRGILPMLDVDRIVWRRFGEIGIGGTIGFVNKSAKAFENGSNPNDPDRPRSSGDRNSFRLLPLAALATYRFTYLDDTYGIPLIPYVRGGLSYYVWWVKAPSGSTANYAGNKARGGSFGVQGAIGLSLRAERIDADAAKTMREGGLLHAGFYAELSTAKVDGFGSDSKLAVGDTTWFAGIDFEY
jgi:hypothetical protein